MTTSATRTSAAGTQREQLDLLNQLNGLHKDSRGGDDQLEARIQSLEIAYRMQTDAQKRSTSPVNLLKVRRVLRQRLLRGCVPGGPAARRTRCADGTGLLRQRTTVGRSQRRGEGSPQQRRRTATRRLPRLLRDLKAKGLLDETLVLWGGEFGARRRAKARTAAIHNNHGFCVWLAGGGVKGGMTYGSTDEFGFAAAEKKVHIHDLHATILHLMGLDHEKLTYRYSGRDFRLTDVHGVVVKDILK